MGIVLDLLKQDVRFHEGLKACMNCGVCTAICPAAEFYDYDPRMLVSIVQSNDEEAIIELLKSDTIWYCGQCMSCKTRCPRNNCPGLVINVLRKISQELGYFTESVKGRQQILIKRNIGDTILKTGYCIHPSIVKPELHPEQGPVWEWVYNNPNDVYERMGGNFDKEGAGTLRKINNEVLGELKAIFEVTGGTLLFDKIEKFSAMKAREAGLEGTDGNIDKYIEKVNAEDKI
ncbi:MAG: 4Fe-4S dicluster domain-containing protein [Bacteroidales bacterium]|nr:4Fe-4S dicluster domain-containing protein [Bacteroidales bacterium]